jgi:hypothetical protein
MNNELTSSESEETATIYPIHTSCGDCIFSEKDKKTQTQIGCAFNKIEIYKNKGDGDVIEAYDEFNNEFFIINNHICLHKRTKEWAKSYTKKQWKPAVEEQLKIHYHAMVIFRENQTPQGLLQTMKSLNRQKIPPSLLTIISRSKMAASELVKIIETETDLTRHAPSLPELSEMAAEDLLRDDVWNFPWRLQTFLDENLIDREAIDLVVDASKYIVQPMFYIVFEAAADAAGNAFEVPPTLSEEMQNYFINEMNHAIFAYPRKDGNGMLVNSMFHKKHAGNCFGINIEDKLKEFEPGAEQYFKHIEDICPSLKL